MFLCSQEQTEQNMRRCFGKMSSVKVRLSNLPTKPKIERVRVEEFPWHCRIGLRSIAEQIKSEVREGISGVVEGSRGLPKRRDWERWEVGELALEPNFSG